MITKKRILYHNFRIDAAIRVIRYANDYNFFDKGRSVELYAAAALYITLRFKKVLSNIKVGSLLTNRFQ